MFYEKLRQEIKLTAILVYSRIGQLHEIDHSRSTIDYLIPKITRVPDFTRSANTQTIHVRTYNFI